MSYSTSNSTYFNVTNLGINPNGVTDNRVALQNAINSLYVRSPGGLFFPKGTYYWSGTIDVTGRDLTFLGEEGAVLLAHTDEAAKKINVSGARRITFDGLTFNSNRTGFTHVSNTLGFVNTTLSEEVKIQNCNFYNTRNSSIFLGGSSKFVTVDKNYFTGYFCAIYSTIAAGESNTERFLITNNVFGNSWITGGSTGESAAIKLQTAGHGYSEGHVIDSNVINTRAQMGIELWQRGRNNIVSNNSIINSPWGISLDNQDNCTVIGNSVKAVSYMAIECATRCHNITVVGNVINGYTGFDTGVVESRYTPYGLSNSNQTNRNLVYDGNIVEGCTYGLNWQGSTQMILSNNILRDNLNNVFIQGGSIGEIHGNIFETGKNSTSNHIFFDASSSDLRDYHISDNRFRGRTTDQSIYYYNNGNPYSIYNLCVENNVTDDSTQGGYGVFIGGQLTPYNYVYRNNFAPSGATAANSIQDAASSSTPYQTTDIENGFQYYGSSTWTVPGSGITGNGIWVCVWSGGIGAQNNVRVSARNYFNDVGNQYNAIELWANMVPYQSFFAGHTLYATPFYTINAFPYYAEAKTLSHDANATNSVWLRIGAIAAAASGQLFYFKYSQANSLSTPFATYAEPADTSNNARLMLNQMNLFNRAYKFSNGLTVGRESIVGLYSSASGVLNINSTGVVSTGRFSMGTSLGNTKIALYDDAVGSTIYGMGIQPYQMRFHTPGTDTQENFAFLYGAAGTELMRIRGNGNVGIGGITNPDQKLTVSGGGIRAIGDGAIIAVSNSNFNSAFYLQYNNNLDFHGDIINNSTGNIYIRPGAVGRGYGMTLRNNGNVGIGNDLPLTQLDISGLDGRVWIRSGAGGGLAASAGAGLKIEFAGQQASLASYNYATSTACQLVLNSAGGNVGIGTASPARKLTVHEGAAANSTIQISNSTTTDNTNSGFHLVCENSTTHAYLIQRQNANMYLRTNNTDRVVITSGGNVGIGITNPEEMLHVKDNLTVGPFVRTGTYQTGAITTTGPFSSFVFARRDLTSWPGPSAGPGDSWIWYSPDRNSARFFTTSKGDLLTITSGGNVGIGTTVPGWPVAGFTNLDVRGSTAAGLITVSTSATAADGVQMGQFAFIDPNISATPAAARMYCQYKGNVSNNRGSNLIFSTKGDGGSLTDRMIITESGNVGIGTTNPTGGVLHVYSNDSINTAYIENIGGGSSTRPTLRVRMNAASAARNILQLENSNGEVMIVRDDGNVGIGTTGPSAQLHTTSTVRFANFGAGTATFDANGNVSSVSDGRYKNIISGFYRGVADLTGISGILHTWKPESQLETSGIYVGFLAQNVMQHIPEAVFSGQNGYLSLSDRPIIAALVNAIKELNERIKALENKS